MSQKKILIVEDEEDINALVALNLEILGHQVTRCYDGLDGYREASEAAFDLIILDIMLPGMDGLNVCRKLREDENFTPILMLTAKNTETDRVLGLEVGADDYLTKPFSVLELQARVKAILRRMQFNSASDSEQDDGNYFQSRELLIDKVKRIVKVADKQINLTAKEFDLLLYLAASPGRVYSRDQLLDAVWGYKHSGYEHTVNSHINRLRSKLEKDPAEPEYVLTVWGVGYKFNDE